MKIAMNGADVLEALGLEIKGAAPIKFNITSEEYEANLNMDMILIKDTRPKARIKANKRKIKSNQVKR
jgi:hypothetical protein